MLRPHHHRRHGHYCPHHYLHASEIMHAIALIIPISGFIGMRINNFNSLIIVACI